MPARPKSNFLCRLSRVFRFLVITLQRNHGSRLRPKTLSIDTWKYQHTETSKLLRQSLVTLSVYSLFCLIMLSLPDKHLILNDAVTTIPFAGVSVSLASFLKIGPALYIILSVYTHILRKHLLRLGASPDPSVLPTPYLFNLTGVSQRAITFIQFYIMPVGVLGVFAWKAIPRVEGGYLYFLVGLYLIFLVISNSVFTIKKEKIVSVLTLSASILGVFLIAYPSWMNSRGLNLFKADLVGQDLRGVNFSYADLREANLSEALLDNASFYNANLEHANFKGIQAKNADFSYTNAKGTVFNASTLVNVTFDYANLEASSFYNVKLFASTLYHVDLVNLNFGGAIFNDVKLSLKRFYGNKFYNASFSNVSTDIVDFENNEYSSVTFIGMDFSNHYFKDFNQDYVTFKQCNFFSYDFSGKRISTIKFVDSDLESTNFERSQIEHVHYTGSNLKFAKFSHASFSLSNFNSTDMTDSMWMHSDLDHVHFIGSRLVGANFKHANIAKTVVASNVNYSGKLKANNFSNAILTCDQFKNMKGGYMAYRSENLACDEPIPEFQSR